MSVLIWWLPALLVVLIAAALINRRPRPGPTRRQLRAIGEALATSVKPPR